MIYFLYECELGRIKIGFTGRAILPRVGSFQTGNSQPLRLLGVILGDRKLEQSLHRRFLRQHIRGEWFSGEVLNDVMELIQQQGVRS